MSAWTRGEWKRTPLWLRLTGYPGWRRWTVLDYYGHYFSEWEYTTSNEGEKSGG